MKIDWLNITLVALLIAAGIIIGYEIAPKKQVSSTTKVMLLMAVNPDSTCCEEEVTPTTIIATRQIIDNDTVYLDAHRQPIPHSWVIFSVQQIP